LGIGWPQAMQKRFPSLFSAPQCEQLGMRSSSDHPTGWQDTPEAALAATSRAGGLANSAAALDNAGMKPILFTIPLVELPVYAYGVMLGLAFITCWYLTLHFANRQRMPYREVTTALVLAIVFALIGARIAHIISNSSWDVVRMKGLFNVLFASRCEGLVAYGGYIGGTLAVVVYAWLKKFDFWNLADCASPALVMGLGFTRIGCFLAGCCYGQVTDLPWGVSFPPGSQAARELLGSTAGANAWSPHVHPTQLYESLLGWLLLPVAILALKKRRFTGQAFLIMIPLYAIGRFLLEMIRDDDDRGTVFGVFSTSQFIGVVLVPLAIGLMIWRWRVHVAPSPWLTAAEVRQSLIDQNVVPEGKKGDKKEAPKEGKKRGKKGK
jgi:phosphatidylglycerol---prolipoprotein diacylglyceryl transferase